MRRAMIYPDNYPPEKTNTGTLYDTPVPLDSNVSRNPSLAMSQRGVTYGAPLGPPPLYTQRETNEYNRANQHGQSLQMTASASTSRPPSGAASPGMKSKFMGNTASDMFESLPPCFSRSPPYHELMAAPFPTFSLISIDSNLDEGFPAVIPPSPCQPHPFIVHDVHEEDWTRLLNDVKVVSKLSGRDKVVSNVVPMLSGAGLVGGLFLTRAIERGMKKKKVAIVADIIDHWNLHFFHPRLMRITLAQGRVVHAGETGPPPDMPNLHSLSDHNEQNTYINTTEQVSDSDSSSSSSSEDEDARHGSRHEHDGSYDSKEARRREKRQRKQERKELKQERKRDKKQKRNEWKQEKDERRYARRRRKQAIKDASGEKWRLIVSFRPPSV